MNRKKRANLARERIGMVFQSYQLLDDLTVAENIGHAAELQEHSRERTSGMVADILDRFQIVARRICFQISFQAASSNL